MEDRLYKQEQSIIAFAKIESAEAQVFFKANSMSESVLTMPFEEGADHSGVSPGRF